MTPLVTRLGKWNEEVGTPSIRERLRSKGPAQALVFFVEKVVESCLKSTGSTLGTGYEAVRGVRVVRWGVGKLGGGRRLAGEQGKAGRLCGTDFWGESGQVKGKKPPSRKATSITIGRSFIFSWALVLCASVCRFVSCLNPADAGSVWLHTATSSHGKPILWTAILLGCSYTPG